MGPPVYFAMVIHNWVRVALVNLVLAAILGALIRLAWVIELTWLDVRHATHGHSHVAILGWVYLALYAFFVEAFVPAGRRESRFYSVVFWLTQVAVLGMFITFPLQGYAGLSIAFSTLHVALSFGFAFRFFRDTRAQVDENHSLRFAKTGLWFMLLSTLGLLAIPVVFSVGLAGSEWYVMAIQFFLHFQFNGWFLFAAVGLFFYLCHTQGIRFGGQPLRRFHLWWVIATLPTFALALTWANPAWWLFALNSLGVIIQLVALVLFFQVILPRQDVLKESFRGLIGVLLVIALLAFTLKMLVQTAVVIPYLATVAYTIRNLVIGFLHLILLGVMTPFIWAFGMKTGVLHGESILAKSAILLLIFGVVSSELILFIQGLMFWGNQGFLPGYYELLFGVSALLPLAALLFLMVQMVAPRSTQLVS